MFKRFRLHCRETSLKDILEQLIKMEERIMVKFSDVLASVEQEKNEVLDGLTELNKMIQDLKDQLAKGEVITPEQMDQLNEAIHSIFVKPSPTP